MQKTRMQEAVALVQGRVPDIHTRTLLRTQCGCEGERGDRKEGTLRVPRDRHLMSYDRPHKRKGPWSPDSARC